MIYNLIDRRIEVWDYSEYDHYNSPQSILFKIPNPNNTIPDFSNIEEFEQKVKLWLTFL